MAVPQLMPTDTLELIFKRDDVRGIWPEQLDSTITREIGRAFTEWVRDTTTTTIPEIAVGRDARMSSVDLLLAFCEGVAAGGGRPVSLGLCSTELVYYAAGKRADRFAAGAMITASHNPPQYNGIKMVKQGAVPLAPADLTELKRRVAAALPPTCDLRAEFAAHVLELAGLPRNFGLNEPVRAAIEAGNGVGGQSFIPVAAALEASGQFEFVFSGEVPDGSFPAGIVPNPLLERYMATLSQRVRESGADLGVAFDGDGDRAGFCDGGGHEICASNVIALVARKLAAERASREAPPIVMRNLCGSKLIAHLFPPDGPVELVDTPVGHGKVKLLMRTGTYRERVLFAGEHSGHYFYPDFCYVDSGILTTLFMLGIAAEAARDGTSLATMLGAWRQRYAWSGEKNFAFAEAAGPKNAMRRVHAEFSSRPEAVRFEIRKHPVIGEQKLERVTRGSPYEPDAMDPCDLKLEFAPEGEDGWWLVVRPSGNEPKLRLNVEAWGTDAERRMRERLAEVGNILEQAGGTLLAD